MRNAFVVFGVMLLATGCTSTSEIRSEHKAIALSPASVPTSLSDCDTGDSSTEAPGHQHSIEEYGNYAVAIAEFDDQGWNTGDAGPGGQVDVLMRYLVDQVGESKDAAKRPVTVLVFVHGWHHNAYANDCNLRQFRAMVRMLSDAVTPSDPRRKIVGVYVGWRGESVTPAVLRYTTIATRKQAAEHVAKGSVRELFARLKLFETRHRMSRDDKRVRTIVIGHSFGGLIAYHSLSQSLLEDIVFGDITCKIASATSGAPVKVQTASESSDSTKWEFPDLTVLINPAFESSRYEVLHQASALPPNCTWGERYRPRLITLTADNDSATGTFFPMARWVATIFEGYNERHYKRERDANLNAVGFVDRYRTHTLRKCKVGGKDTVVLAQDFIGGNRDPNSPLVVARATPEVIDGHDGFLYSAAKKDLDLSRGLFDFLVRLYTEGQGKVTGKCDDM